AASRAHRRRRRRAYHGPRPGDSAARTGADLRAVPRQRHGPGTRDCAWFRRAERRPALRRARGARGHGVRDDVSRGARRGGAADTRAARVLVGDDEPQILRALQMKLRGAGYAVDTATTAGEALMKAGVRPPGAMVLARRRADGRGTEVCRRLRE